MIRIDSDCRRLISIAWGVIVSLLIISYFIFGPSWVWITLLVVGIAFGTFITLFHRVPDRPVPDLAPGAVTSVADGKVVIVDKVYEKEFLKRECIQVSIYMSFWDVHANFWPLSGEITYYQYHPGRYFLAFLPKASEENEHSSTAIRGESGEILFRQIAGTFARRLVCYSKVGDSVSRGNQCGIIKFGSRIDFFLPVDARVMVNVGDKVRAVETVIATI